MKRLEEEESHYESESAFGEPAGIIGNKVVFDTKT